MASRPTKLDFKPLSLAETAKRLGIPRKRARRILSLIGVDLETGKNGDSQIKRKTALRKTSQKHKASQ